MTREGCAQLWHVLPDPVLRGWHFSKVGLNSIVSKSSFPTGRPLLVLCQDRSPSTALILSPEPMHERNACAAVPAEQAPDDLPFQDGAACY